MRMRVRVGSISEAYRNYLGVRSVPNSEAQRMPFSVYIGAVAAVSETQDDFRFVKPTLKTPTSATENDPK